jgi:hypothetical protein
MVPFDGTLPAASSSVFLKPDDTGLLPGNDDLGDVIGSYSVLPLF